MSLHTASDRPDALNPYRNSFNTIRLLAALQVVYMHGVAHLGLPRGIVFQIATQFPGVPIFFAASGFLVLDSFMRQKSVPNYSASRALRIFPALVTNIVILELLFGLTGGMMLSNISLFSMVKFEAIYTLTASQDWAEFFAGIYPYSFTGFFPAYPSNVLWTLTVELSFYLILPVLGIFAGRRSLATVVYLVTAAISLSFLFWTSGNYGTDSWIYHARLTFVPYLWMFIIGMLLRLWVVEIARFRSSLPILAVTYLYVAYRTGFSWLDWKMQPTSIDIIKSGMVCALAILAGISPFLHVKALVKNDISYGVYLWHMLFVTTAMALGWTGGFIVFVAVIALSLLTAWASWRLIEKPVLSLKSRLTAPGQSLANPRTQAPQLRQH